jgi:hypothetical protein
MRMPFMSRPLFTLAALVGNVTVQNRPPAMFDDEEAVQQLEGQRGYSEKVERDDGFATIGEKCLPALIVLAGAGPQDSQLATVRSKTWKPSFSNSPTDLRRSPAGATLLEVPLPPPRG